MLVPYIAVHGGAGFHSMKYEKEIKGALRRYDRSCTFSDAPSNQLPSVGWSRHNSPNASLSMVENAICVLEDVEHLNAGYGSNLTIEGSVECDASVMCAQGRHFGSAGAVSGIKNPIRLARCILDYSRIPNRFGRVAPLTLVSDGAYKFVTNAGGIETVLPEALVSPTAQALWEKWKAQLDAPQDVTNDIADEDDPETSLQNIQDTVGSVAFHPVAGMAAGVSRFWGLLMKYPGRVGEAAIFGAGCWATQVPSGFEGMACSISGTGEHIIRENLAAKLGSAMAPSKAADGKQVDTDPHEILSRVLHEFWESCRERGVENPAVGVLLLVSEDESFVRLWCGFTTASMAIGYASSESGKPKAFILRHPNYKARASDKPQISVTSLSLT
ncbi:asparaginase [Gymnopilus junonius]|uniref:Asparaginase n=1 Tax=Gymnopilus junonius TaxID=109634 RepID=A0A9P5NRZ4_GYMJU|nr:asparaginase [Gymnopilus junonius]